jgi:hypothetical protein
MTIHTHATYRDGALYPDEPLGLPENSEVNITVAPVVKSSTAADGDGMIAPPTSPKMTSEEFRALIKKYAVRVGSLPPDFSREDIYSDHD